MAMSLRQKINGNRIAIEAMQKKDLNDRKHYLGEIGSKRGLYFTDHSMVRYAERVMGIWFEGGVSDTDRLKTLGMSPEKLREEICTHDDEVNIISRSITVYRKEGYSLVVSGLTVVTIILN